MNKKEKKAADHLRYLTEKNELIQRLGGKCVVCGSTKRLEFHHKDPATKLFAITSGMRSCTQEELTEELKKCVLLCRKDHMAETIKGRGQQPAEGRHGTLSNYRYCRCKLCVKVHADWCAEYNRKRKEAKRRQKYRQGG